MISKTDIGLKSFDDFYGGTYSGRVTAISGPSKTGKTAMAIQFANTGLKLGENVLLLSAVASSDLAILAESLGMPVDVHVESGALTILEYSDYIPGRDAEENIMLPPECFSHLQAVIEKNAINRVAIDTIVPWIAFPGKRHLAEHIFSFVRAFERLGVTSLFTIPKPASPAAQRMLKYIFDNVPVGANLSKDAEGQKLTWKTVKYLGESRQGLVFNYRMENGEGVVTREMDSSNVSDATVSAAVRKSDEMPIATPFSKSVFSGQNKFGSQRNPVEGTAPKSRVSLSEDKARTQGETKSAFSNVVWKASSGNR